MSTAEIPSGFRPAMRRHLWPPRDLYQRLRWIFFVFSLIEIGLVAGTLEFGTPTVRVLPMRLLVVGCAVGLGVKWYLEYAGRSPLPAALIDLVDAAALGVAAMVIQLPLEIYMLLLTRVSSRSFDHVGRMPLSVVYYAAAFLLPVVVADIGQGSLLFDPDLLLVAVIPLSSFTVQYMGSTLRELRAANRDGEALLAAVTGLEPRMSLSELGEAATAAGLSLLGNPADSSVHFASGDGIRMTVEASSGELSGVGSILSLGPDSVKNRSRPKAGDRWMSTLADVGLAPHRPGTIGTVEVFALEEESNVRGALIVATPEAISGRQLRSFLSLSQQLEAVLEQKALAATIEQQNESTFRQMFLSNPQPMWVFDFQTLGFLEVNDAAVAQYGYSRDEFLQLTLPDIYRPEDVPWLMERLKQGSVGATYVSATTHHHVRKDGSTVLVEVTGQPHLSGGRPAAMGLLRDVTEQVALQKQLKERAFHDPLTGLANRALFADRLGQALAARRPGSPPRVAVVMIDLDNFKTINDTRGHATGDHVLQQVARRLESKARPGDTVARLGGDEFIVLLPDVASLEVAEAVALRLLGGLQDPVNAGGDDWFVSASIGVAVEAEEGVSANDLVTRADVAMYASKHGGRDQVKLYRPTLHAQSSTGAGTVRELSDAIRRGELRVHYQPEVDIASGRMVGVEALVRWMHPQRGLLHPGEFIPLAEEAGLISSIDLWVATQSLHQLKSWEEQGLPQLRVGLNVSAQQLVHASFVDRLATLIKGCDLDPGRVEVEVTETVTVESAGATAALLRLKELGITVALDDFGMGYSMLGRLKDFPVDKLKIDRSFVGQMESPKDEALVAGMISMGHRLHLTVLAEGVEHTHQLDRLTALGCDQVQGYLVSKPVEAADIGRLLGSSDVLAGRPVPAKLRLVVA